MKYFHVSTGLPHDISHDIFEGVASETLSNILTKLISDKLITLEYINIKIRNFPYICNDKKDKPIELRIVKSKIKICYKQAQMWCFIRLLPLMLGDKIPIENDTWELLLKFVNLVESVCVYSFSDSDLSYLDFKIEAFNSHFCKNFPSISVKPKRHYIIHIPKIIRDYGPVIHTWTIRLEAEHEYYKQIIHRTRNTKNITKTFSETKQKKQALIYSKPNILSKDFESSHVRYSAVQFLRNQIRSLVERLSPNSDNIATVDTCTVNGKTYRIGHAVVTGVESEEYIFQN